MNHLAVSQGQDLKLKQFNYSTYFFTDSLYFSKITFNEETYYKLDTLLAALLIILFAPLMALIAIAIKLFMGGNIFFTQVRVGKKGKLFNIIKFRTMIEDAEVNTGPTLATKDDSRITSLGKFLRASHLDELPQIFNVFLGDMTIIGPRPERPEFVSKFNNIIPNYNLREISKPGITGFAQICLPYDATPEEKLEYDLYYIEHQGSLLFNIIISYYTTLKMFTFYKN